jgi:carboxypeptidase Taq
MTSYEKLEGRFRQISRLSELRNIAQWDEAVMMPEGASPYRNEALGELAVVLQNLTCDAEVGAWLAEAEQSPPTDLWRAANLREIKRVYIENTVLPPELNQKLVVARMNSEQQWRRLRSQNDWKSFQPYMQEVLTLTRQMVDELKRKTGLSTYDAAMSMYSPGLNTATVERLFNELKSFLPGFVQKAVDKQATEKFELPEGSFPVAAQKALGLELMQAVGFSMKIGRLDESHHPFCGGNPRDVRITTRYKETDFISSLMGVLHETGHALYEQHLPDQWLTQPVGWACGMAVHESQSLLMEMQVCRSPEFLEFAGPLIRKYMTPYTRNPDSLSNENLAKLVTRVKPGYIRVDADEVTYPAHVILRFEIERDLLEDRWPLSELPGVWNEKMKSYLGLSTLGNDKDGCMQDVHWPGGAFGYFPAYTFGAVIAAQLFAKARGEMPGLPRDISSGNFTPLRSWLNENVWSRGSTLRTLDLVEKVSGPLSSAAFRAHLEKRY